MKQIQDELQHQLKPITMKSLFKKLGWTNFIMFEMMMASAADKQLIIIDKGKVSINTKGNRMIQKEGKKNDTKRY